MKAKTKTTATKEGATPALVPKLRFPEFRDTEGWKAEPMSEVYSFRGNNSLSRDKLNYVAGSVKNIHYGDIHTKGRCPRLVWSRAFGPVLSANGAFHTSPGHRPGFSAHNGSSPEGATHLPRP